MKSTWKSGLRREPVEFLRPNLFYQGRVQGLLDAQNVRPLSCFLLPDLQHSRSHVFFYDVLRAGVQGDTKKSRIVLQITVVSNLCSNPDCVFEMHTIPTINSGAQVTFRSRLRSSFYTHYLPMR